MFDVSILSFCQRIITFWCWLWTCLAQVLSSKVLALPLADVYRPDGWPRPSPVDTLRGEVGRGAWRWIPAQSKVWDPRASKLNTDVKSVVILPRLEHIKDIRVVSFSELFSMHNGGTRGSVLIIKLIGLPMPLALAMASLELENIFYRKDFCFEEDWKISKSKQFNWFMYKKKKNW